MAKRFTDKLKEKIGVKEGAKNSPGSAPKEERKNMSAEGAAQGEAAQAAQKKAPAAQPPSGAAESWRGRLLRTVEMAPLQIGWWPEIYDDTDVCRVVGWRRKKLAESRLPWTRGEEWDVVGMHVGMTGKWIRQIKGVSEAEWPEWAERHGLKRIERDDGIETVEMKRRHPNRQMATVEPLASVEKVVCRVRDSGGIEIGQVFDCRMEGGRLVMKESLNTEAW